MTTKSLHQYRYHSDSIWSLHFDEDHLVTGSADKTIRVQKWSKTVTLILLNFVFISILGNM